MVRLLARGSANYDFNNNLKSSTWVMRVLETINEPPVAGDIPNVNLVLCHVCENSVPAVLFVQHTPLCLAVHSTEMDISLVNDQLKQFQDQLEMIVPTLYGSQPALQQTIAVGNELIGLIKDAVEIIFPWGPKFLQIQKFGGHDEPDFSSIDQEQKQDCHIVFMICGEAKILFQKKVDDICKLEPLKLKFAEQGHEEESVKLEIGRQTNTKITTLDTDQMQPGG